MKRVTVDDAGATVETLESFVADVARGVSLRGNPTTGDELPSVGSVVAERYVLERLVGQGGMGAVFAGRHIVTGRRVAIKVLRGDPAMNRAAALRMAREARAVGRIHHPNVVAVLDAGFAVDRPFIAMELLEGESLEQRIERCGPMSEPEAIATLQQIMRGVEAAHANGIIHRDLKPANILLCPAQGAASDTVKVVDFGISKLRGDGEEDVLVTCDGAQLGTPVFMSPEQVRGDSLDVRTDVYALAVILYYMLSVRYPFHAGNRAELFAKILTAEPVPLAVHRPGVSKAIAKVVLRALARDRARRYDGVSALADALSRATSHRPKSRLAAFSSRIVSVPAAVSGILLVAMSSHPMHATPPTPAGATTIQAQAAEQPMPALTPASSPSESADTRVVAPEPEPEPQPSAAKQKPAPVQARTPKLAHAKPKAREPRSSADHAATSARDDTATIARDDAAAGELMLMSW